jgi:uncharacterized protein
MATDTDRTESAEPAEVVTSGTGEVERVADRAQLRLGYTATGKDRTAAVSELTRRIGTVEPHLDRAGVEVRDRQLSVHDVWTGRRRSGAQADQHYLLRITDVSVLDDLLATLVTTEPNSLDGPNWELADPSAAFRDAQRAAVADAHSRAEGFADALGARLGGLVRLTDGSQPHHGQMRFGAQAPMGMASARAMPETAELSLQPQVVTVSADCTITWRLAHDAATATSPA